MQASGDKSTGETASPPSGCCFRIEKVPIPVGLKDCVIAPMDIRHPHTTPVNLAEKLALFSDHWKPRTVAQLNDFDIMVVKVQGEFVWHTHDETDDFFLVLSGRLQIRLRDRTVILNPGELFVVSRGVQHQPFAEVETHVLLIEPTGTPNTGDVETAAPRQIL
jgi:mannose-6-phosphate isomerase-like protein (cupin superfamily)